MRGVFSRGTRVAAACLLIVVLLAPTALASDDTDDPSLWDAFVAWLAGRIDIPGGLTAQDVDMGRIHIPGG